MHVSSTNPRSAITIPFIVGCRCKGGWLSIVWGAQSTEVEAGSKLLWDLVRSLPPATLDEKRELLERGRQTGSRPHQIPSSFMTQMTHMTHMTNTHLESRTFNCYHRIVDEEEHGPNQLLNKKAVTLWGVALILQWGSTNRSTANIKLRNRY